MLTYCLNPPLSLKQSPLEKECKLQRLFSSRRTWRVATIFRSASTPPQKSCYYYRMTQSSMTFTFNFQVNTPMDDTVQRISLSSKQGQQHPLVVASVGNPDQPNNQIFTLEKQTFSPTKVKIVSVGQTTLSWSRDWPTWLRHLNSIPTTFDSIVVIAIYCFGFFIRGSRKKDNEKCGLGKSSSSSFW